MINGYLLLAFWLCIAIAVATGLTMLWRARQRERTAERAVDRSRLIAEAIQQGLRDAEEGTVFIPQPWPLYTADWEATKLKNDVEEARADSAASARKVREWLKPERT